MKKWIFAVLIILSSVLIILISITPLLATYTPALNGDISYIINNEDVAKIEAEKRVHIIVNHISNNFGISVLTLSLLALINAAISLVYIFKYYKIKTHI